MAKRETLEQRKSRVARIIKGLHKLYPKADCALKHDNAWQLLVATILSAQSTDETVNKVTPELFRKYPSAASLAKANIADVEAIIRPSGFFRQKSKNIVGAAKLVAGEFDGKVPDTMDNLLKLPGVARKTANVVLGTWFKRNEGVVVDTHVGRLADRLRLVWNHKDTKDAIRIEKDLIRMIPQREWTFLSHALIWHGRRVCTARKPDCEGCGLCGECPSAFKVGGASVGSRA